ncbi:hypothetical protein BH11ARM1_BH11ARM1_12870 [soil metagenome]
MQSNEILVQALNGVTDGVAQLTDDGQVTFQNLAWSSLSFEPLTLPTVESALSRCRKSKTDTTLHLTSDLGRTFEIRIANAAKTVMVRDVTSEAQLIAKSERYEDRLQTLVLLSNDLVWTADPVLGFIEPQPLWEALTGQKFDEYRELGHFMAYHPEDRARARVSWVEATSLREPCSCDYRIYNVSLRAYRRYSLKASPILRQDGSVREWIGVLSDIHEQYNAEHSLAELRADLETRVAERTTELEGFTNSVAHDIRVPLKSIRQTSKILLEEYSESLSSDARVILERQEESAAELEFIIDELLQLTRISRQTIKVVSTDMTDLVQKSVALFEKQYPDIEFTVQPGMKAVVDQALFSLVWHNLLDNACKFSAGSGVVEVGCENRRFFVRDEGIGFDEAHKTKVFLPFERLVRADQFVGTGIGLANVKRIIDRHNGEVWAESEEGKGSTFSFTLNSRV